jgi:hypothetical protein
MDSTWLEAVIAGGEPKIKAFVVFPAQISLSLL